MWEKEYYFSTLRWKHVRKTSAAPDMGNRPDTHSWAVVTPDEHKGFRRTPTSDRAAL